MLQQAGPLPTGWEVLEKGWTAIDPWTKGYKNSEYRNTQIELQDLKPWKDFPDYENIYRFSRSTEFLREQFHEQTLPIIAEDLSWYERYFKTPSYQACPAEITTVERRCAFFDQLNSLIRLATPGGDSGRSYVMIGSGKLAMYRRTATSLSDKNLTKDPDRVAFWTDSQGPRRNSVEQGDVLPEATKVPCLIGDYKMNAKFNHAMLQNIYSGRSRKSERFRRS